jgi:mono/diheme cytochrome c family protein
MNMKRTTVVAAVIATVLLFAGAAVAERAISTELARRGADDAAEGGHRGDHHRGAETVPAGNGAGKALFEAKCSACHDLDRALQQTKDRNGWTATVKRMQQVNGCPITDAQAVEIIDHLVKIRGKDAAKP